MSASGCIVLTGGPGGGKSTLIEELLRDPAWRDHIAVLPEAISLMHAVGISPREQLFQRVMVHLQMALEDGLWCGLGSEDRRSILCHRGSLDPLAYWLDRGWTQRSFFSYTGTDRSSLYNRYVAVIHLVTTADGAPEHYARWPRAGRGETVEEAARIDGLLEQVWSGHPAYYRLDNHGRDWPCKAALARDILQRLIRSGAPSIEEACIAPAAD